MFTETKQIRLEGKAIITTTMDGTEIDRKNFTTEAKAREEFKQLFREMNPDPETRMEMHEQDVWTIYEKN